MSNQNVVYIKTFPHIKVLWATTEIIYNYDKQYFARFSLGTPYWVNIYSGNSLLPTSLRGIASTNYNLLSFRFTFQWNFTQKPWFSFYKMQFKMSAFMCQVNVEWVKAGLFPGRQTPSYRYRYGILHVAMLFQSGVSTRLFIWLIPIAAQTDYNVLSRYSYHSFRLRDKLHPSMILTIHLLQQNVSVPNERASCAITETFSVAAYLLLQMIWY